MTMAFPADPKAGFLALSRFGYGPRGDGDAEAAARDPRGFLAAELAEPDLALLAGAGLPTSAKAAQLFFADQAEKKAERDRLAAMQPLGKVADATVPPNQTAAKPQNTANAMMAAPHEMAGAMTNAPQPNAAQPNAMKPPQQPPSPEQIVFRDEALARIRRAITARAGIVERLVAFWSNHFCVSANKSGIVRILAGAFEREAIRPHVLGRFVDMVMAVESHPAMLQFLDNAQSIGPDSEAGLKSKRGLNENLGREILELHTLGVGSYQQNDVTSLARILTGWSSAGPQGHEGEPGAFIFNAHAHEPGTANLLGKAYAEQGRAQGEAALIDLTRKPATAHFIATKFARHFIADTPDPALVAALANVFMATDGDLKALTFALIDNSVAFTAPAAKMRTPYEYLIAVNRALGHVPDEPGQILGPLNNMGMPLWTPPGPNGYADTVAAWATPEGMKLRLDFAGSIADHLHDPPNPSELLDALCGPAASAETRQAVARAESKRQGLALLFMTPEFQRR
jgi:uncharacterized protein (DUF1800 family)